MSRRWTNNQLRAIEVRDRDVCVSAGAGSGKTGVLVERFVRIVSEGLDLSTPADQRAGVENILVITFTEKATREMKGRIVEELTLRGLTGPRREVETAYISTIHGFCSRLLKENPFEAGVDPAFPVLEENDARRLFRNAVEEAVENAFAEDDEDIIELVVGAQDERMFGSDTGDPLSALADSVRTVLSRVRGAGWRLETLRARLAGEEQSAADGPSALLRAVRAELAACGRELTVTGVTVMGAMAAVRQELLAQLRALGDTDSDADGRDRWGVAATMATGIETIAKTAQRGLRSRPNANPAETDLQKAFARIKAAAQGAAGLFAMEAEGEERAQVLAAKFWRLLLRTWERYEALKRSESALDNDDLQAEAVALLEASISVRDRYRRRFRHLMVDEFQDTNPVQMRLLDLLHESRVANCESRAPGQDGESYSISNNLFVVGDVQQSIYAFRNADPTIFRDVERRFRSDGAVEHVTLAENFRSHPHILGFINGLFGQIWQGTDSEATPFMALKCGTDEPEPRGPTSREPVVELLLARDPGRAQYIPLEAEAIARRIREMVGSGVEFRDIAVLLRALTDIEHYERALHEEGVPYYVVGGGRGYYARFEVRDILSVLTVLESPLSDLEVAATLRSPMVGLSAETLFALSRFARREGRKGSLYTCLTEFVSEHGSAGTDAAELRRIGEFRETMERIRRREDRQTVAQILETVIAETDLDSRLLVRPNGRRRLANVRKLLQMAYEDPSQSTGQFIRRLREIEKLTDREGDAPTEEEASQVVRLLTIHKAKGLEFPVVFVGDMARGLAFSERGLFTCDGRTLRLGCKLGEYKDVTYRSISEAKQQAELEESFRVLYVALTRARERLILCGSTPHARKRGSNWADTVFPIAGVLGPPEEPEIRVGPGGVPMRVANMVAKM